MRTLQKGALSKFWLAKAMETSHRKYSIFCLEQVWFTLKEAVAQAWRPHAPLFLSFLFDGLDEALSSDISVSQHTHLQDLGHYSLLVNVKL